MTNVIRQSEFFQDDNTANRICRIRAKKKRKITEEGCYNTGTHSHRFQWNRMMRERVRGLKATKRVDKLIKIVKL